MKQLRTASALAVALTVIACMGQPVASVADVRGSQSEDVPAVDSWALAPTGANPDEPSTRANLSYEIAPGTTVDDSVTLWNYGNTELSFQVYATDAFNNTTGDFDVLTSDRAPSDVGSWVSALPTDAIVVPARKKVDLPFKLTVPPDARPGDHAAAILASSVVEGQDTDGRKINVDRRTGSRIYLRVAGALQPVLAVEQLHTAYHAALNPLGGGLDVSYTIRNTGNVRVGVHQHVQLDNPFGRRMQQTTPGDVTELLPGNAVTVKAHFTSVTAALRVATKVVVTPFQVGDAGSPAAPPIGGASHAWAIPWSIVLLVLVAGTVRQGVRRRRRGVARPASGGEAAGLAGVAAAP